MIIPILFSVVFLMLGVALFVSGAVLAVYLLARLGFRLDDDVNLGGVVCLGVLIYGFSAFFCSIGVSIFERFVCL